MCYLFLEEINKAQRHGMDKTLNFRRSRKTIYVPRCVESMKISSKK
jgi:hypothetical protein